MSTCRAQVSRDCPKDDEKAVAAIYRHLGEIPQDDNTYDPETDTVVCDACYIVLDTPVTRELENAIKEYKSKNP